jgi:hypothetical protein
VTACVRSDTTQFGVLGRICESAQQPCVAQRLADSVPEHEISISAPAHLVADPDGLLGEVDIAPGQTERFRCPQSREQSSGTTIEPSLDAPLSSALISSAVRKRRLVFPGFGRSRRTR